MSKKKEEGKKGGLETRPREDLKTTPSKCNSDHLYARRLDSLGKSDNETDGKTQDDYKD